MAQESRLAIVLDSRNAKVDAEQLKRALDDLERAGVRVVGASADTKRGLDSMGESARRSSSSIEGVAAALASVVSTAKLFGAVENVTRAAGRYEQLGVVVQTLGRNAGYTSQELSQLQGQLEKTGISMTQSRQVMAQMIQANMDLSQATQLARLAQNAATIANISSSEALQRMVYGIQSSQVEILRNIGIVVNFESAYKQLAGELGKTTAALTEQEKLQARVNIVMAQSSTLMGAYEASMETAEKQLGSMSRHQENLAVLMGQAFQPAYRTAVDAMTQALKFGAENAGAMSVALASVTAAAATATTGILATATATRALTAAMVALARNPVVLTLTTAAAAAAGLYTYLNTNTRAANEVRNALGLMWKDAAPVVDRLQDKLGGVFEDVREELRSFGIELPTTFREAMLGAAYAIDSLDAVVYGSAAAIEAAFDTATDNIYSYFVNAWNDIKRSAAAFVNDLAGMLNSALEAVGMATIEPVKWGDDAGIRAIKDIGGAMVDAYAEAAEAAREASGAHAYLEKVFVEASIWSAIEEWEQAYGALPPAIKKTGDALDDLGESGKNGKKGLTDAQKAAEAFSREREQSLRSQYASISALHEEAQALEDQVALFGLGKTAVEDLTIARLEEQAALLSGFAGSQEQLEVIQREIEARQRLRTAIGSLETKEAEKAAWESWSRDVEQIFQQVGQSLTDAIFEGGKSGRDLIKDLFKTLTLRVVINPVMGALQNAVTNSLGGAFGYSNPAQQQGSAGIMGMLGQANQLYGALTGGMSSSIATGISTLGQKMGSEALSNFAAGMKGSTLAPGLHGPTTAGASGATGAGSWIGSNMGSILGYGAAFYNLAQGNYGSAIGTAIGTAILPGVGTAIGSVAGSLVDGVFGDREPTTRREQRTQIEFANGLFGTTRTDDRMPGADAAARQLAEQAVQTANDIFQRVGVDAAIDSFHAIMASSYKGDRDGVASGGTLRIGDQLRQFGIANEGNPTIQGFGGWSDADTLPRLATDIQLSILEAFQSAGVLSSILEGIDIRGLGEQAAQELAASVQQIVGEASAFQEAIESLPFANLRDLSFDAAANLIQFAGGLDQLNAGMATYFQEFYSQEEQLAQATQNMSRAFGELGLELPDVSSGADQARAAYRALVESLDVTTEEGQRTYAALMGLAGGFSQLVSGMDELAEASRRAAEEDARIAKQRRDDALGYLSEAYNAVVEAGQREIAQLQESFSATDSAMNAYRSKVQEYINSFNGLFSAIDQGVNALRGTGAAFQADYNRARAVISTTLLTGQLPQTADLSDALRVAQQGVTGQVYASRFEQEKAYATLANEMEALRGIAEPELDAAQATLDQLEDQYRLLRGMSRVGEDSLEKLQAQLRTALSTEEVARSQISLVESQLEEARRQYDALTGIDTSIKDLATAMREFAAAATAARTVVGGGGGGGGSNLGLDPVTHPNPVGPGSAYDRARDYYAENWDVANAWNSGSTGMTYDEFAQWHYETYGRSEGRSYDVGTSFVPYDMKANIHRGEIIIDSRSSDILRRYGIGVQGGNGDPEQRELLRQVVARLDQLEAAGRATAVNTGRIHQKLDDVTQGGTTVRTSEVATA